MELARGTPFLIPSDGGHAFGVVLHVKETGVYVALQSGHRGTVPAAVIEAGRVLLGKYAEEVNHG